jgi:hypothetical protein
MRFLESGKRLFLGEMTCGFMVLGAIVGAEISSWIRLVASPWSSDGPTNSLQEAAYALVGSLIGFASGSLYVFCKGLWRSNRWKAICGEVLVVSVMIGVLASYYLDARSHFNERERRWASERVWRTQHAQEAMENAESDGSTSGATSSSSKSN